ncbi:MAG: hypothetical protein IKX55_04775 [Bacteroidaceae bacterium]|nr:hypothetical protein [Bacteroidaceae bacterium]
MLFVLITTCQASAQKGFFGSISRQSGIEYFYTNSVNRSNPNISKRVPKIKGLDTEYLINHLSSIEMVSATPTEKGLDKTAELEESVNSTMEENEFETLYQIIEDEQELTVYTKADKWGGYRIVIAQKLKREPPRFLAVSYQCFKCNLDELFKNEE